MWAEILMVLREHWPEYLMEAAELGMFMVSACVFATILGHPPSLLAEALPPPTLQLQLSRAPIRSPQYTGSMV
jgi:aquaporin Z